MESSSSAASSKKAKAPTNISQVVQCLVDGCNSDLSQCRDYHRRHKVCELHSKTAKVTIGGREQRFCQQCSRFHSLDEFDEGKRSCRKRLDGHNRRRRKPQPESLSRNTGRIAYNQQGPTMLSFSSPQVFSTAWTGAANSDYNSSINYIHSHENIPGGNRFQILQGDDIPFSSVSVAQPTLCASGHSRRGQKMFSHGLNQMLDSDCALSLLSSASAETREIGLSHVMQPDPIPSVQYLVDDLNYGNLSHCSYSQGMDSGASVTVLPSNETEDANLHCQGMMFQDGPPDGSSASGSHHTLSFRW